MSIVIHIQALAIDLLDPLGQQNNNKTMEW